MMSRRVDPFHLFFSHAGIKFHTRRISVCSNLAATHEKKKIIVLEERPKKVLNGSSAGPHTINNCRMLCSTGDFNQTDRPPAARMHATFGTEHWDGKPIYIHVSSSPSSYYCRYKESLKA